MPWSRSDRPVPRLVLRPLQSFLQTEASGGVLLLVATVVALAWANSPWQGSYERFLHAELAIRLGRWGVSEDLQHWVSDAAMTLFFLVVGLEIKRELLTGELRDPRAVALPAIAALGGMLLPAAIYLVFNVGGPGSRGWGIPMATDPAFAIGLLTLAARAAPPSVKSFLLTLAIVDDIGAIVVLALFYSGRIDWAAVTVAALLCLVILGVQRINVRASGLYVLLGVGVLLATLNSGVHPTIAGVALGFLTPAAAFQRPRAVSDEAHRIANETVDDPFPPDADAHHWLRLTDLSREAIPPLARIEHVLHPWTSYVIVPLFALVNAGVVLSSEALRDAVANPITLGVAFGLVIGKTVGVSLASLIAVRLGFARLPTGATLRHVVGTAAVAGIGFTVSLFVAELAFPDPLRQGAAKIGILAASVLAGVLALVVFRSTRDVGPMVVEDAR